MWCLDLRFFDWFSNEATTDTDSETVVACNFRFLSIGFELESYGIPSPLLLRSVHYSVYRQVRVVFVHFSPEADSYFEIRRFRATRLRKLMSSSTVRKKKKKQRGRRETER